MNYYYLEHLVSQLKLIKLFFQAKMQNICCVQFLPHEDVLLFFITYDTKLNIFKL